MDSTRVPALPRPSPVVTDPPAARPALARLGRVLPAAAALVRFSYRTAVVSAMAVLAVVVAVTDRVASIETSGLVLLGAVLLVPAAAAVLVGWTVGDLLRLPGEIRDAAVDAARDLRAGGRPRGLAGVVVAVWAARGLVLSSRDGWMRALVAVRLARLASLPLVLLSLGLFLLNGVVVAAGAVALILLLL